MIDSEEDVAKTVRTALKGLTEGVDYAADGSTALLMVGEVNYALIVLDVLLPRLGGAKLCAAMRAQRSETPILALTACAEAISSLLGLHVGVNDYLPKPVDVAELRGRAAALIDEYEKARDGLAPREPVQVAALFVDPTKREIRVHGRPLHGISAQEAEVLHFLAQHPGVPYSREELLSAVWGIHHPIDFKLVGVNLARLRDKIRAAAGYEYLASTEEARHRSKRYLVRPPAWTRMSPVLVARRRSELYGKP